MAPKKQKPRSSQRKAQETAMRLYHPPQRRGTINYTFRARYIAQTATQSPLNVTRAILLNTLIVNVSSITVNYRMLSGIRMKAIEMWQAGTSTFTPTTVSVEWVSNNGPSTIHSDTSMTVTPAHVSSSPPVKALGSFWSLTANNESDVICILTYGTGAVIDVVYEGVLQNGEASTLVTSNQNGTIGTVYMTPLDGVGASRDLIPASYQSKT